MDKGTIIVVEDQPDIREALAELLLDEGYRVVGAEHGAAALNLIEAESPGLLVTDFDMPVMDGRELLWRIQRNPGLRRIPTVVFTGDASVDGATIPNGVEVVGKAMGVQALLAAIRTRMGPRPD